MGYVYLFRSIAQLSIVFVLCSFLTFVLCDHFTWLMTPSLGNCTCGKRSQCAPLRVSPPQQGSTAAKLEKLTRVNMSLTLSCKLVEVFAMICAVLLQNQAQDSVVLCHQIPHFHSPHRISSLWRPFALWRTTIFLFRFAVLSSVATFVTSVQWSSDDSQLLVPRVSRCKVEIVTDTSRAVARILLLEGV